MKELNINTMLKLMKIIFPKASLSKSHLLSKNILSPSYRNQSIDLLRKSIDWFSYEGNTST